MRWNIILLACLLCKLVSCSPFHKVSKTNIEKHQISTSEITDLQYEIRKQKLHYVHAGTKYIINNYNVNETAAYESLQAELNDHISIPKGAVGNCVGFDDNIIIIDFGKGVIIPFIVMIGGNSPMEKIMVDERFFDLKNTRQKTCLYFNSAN